MANFEILVGTKVSDTIQKQLDASPKKTVTVTPILNTKGIQTGTKSISQYVDSAGKMVTVTDKLDMSGKTVSSTFTKVKSTVDTTSKSVQTASKHTKTLGEDFVSTAGKVAKFGAITAIFGLVTRAIGEAVSSVKELDSVMTEFNKVSDLSGESLTEYTKMLGEMGTEVARTRSEMISASTEFVKSGYTEEQSAQLAKIASLYQNVADSEISAGESSSYLISQMKAFNITAEDAISIIDKTNEVANKFAVSSTDISTALTKSSSALAVYGNDINQTIAMVTAGSEVMTGQAGKVSKGLRSIGANIVKLADDAGVLEYNVNGITKSLSLFDDTGKALSTFDVLSKVAEDWDAMTQAERSSLALAQAGKTQIDVYTSVLGNFDTALKANEVALGSQGSAMKENEAYMESIEARTKKLQAQFDLLVNGDGGLNTFIKGLLDGSTAILKFANSDIGQLIIKTTALVAVFGLLQKSMVFLNSKSLIISGISSIIAGEATLAQVTTGLTANFVANATAWALTPMGMATIAIGAIGLLVVAFNKFNVTLEENQEKLSKLKEEYNSSVSSVKSLEEQLQNVHDKIKEINDLDGINITNDGELAELERQESKLQSILAIEQERKRLANQELEKQAKKTVYSKVEDAGAFGTTTSYEGVEITNEGTRVEALKKYSDEMERQQSIITSLSDKKDRLGYLNESESEYLSKSISKYDEASSKASEYATALQSEVEGLNETSDTYKYAMDGLSKYGDVLSNTAKKQDEIAESTSNTNVEFEDSVSTLEEQAKAYQEAIAGFSDIQSAYDTLKSASDEYNKTGTYSLETISKLLALNEEYAGALKLVDGQMVVSEEAIRNKVIAQAEEAKQEIYNTALKKLNALASAESGEASTLAGKDHSSATTGIDAETKSLSANTTEKLKNAIADAKGRGASSDDVNKVLKEMSEQLALVNKATISIDSNFEGSMGTAEHSTKKATNALKDQKDALNDLKSQYDSAIDYIVSKYDDEIDAIEKAKKVALDAVDARIKAKNREKDNELKAIDDEINALEYERDAREAYWDSVINGLKKVNTERERALALQQAQEVVTSAKSKKVMIFKDKSFGYGINESEVASAEQNLSDLQQDQAYEIQLEKLEALKSAELANYESRLNSLKSYKDSVSASYDEQISNLESYREAVEANYDAQIAYYEMYKEQFIEMTEQYQKSQDELMASQLTGIDLENNHWMTRLGNLNKFVSSYNSLLNRIGSSSSINTSSVQARGYASGIASVPSDQMAVIGDNPSNSELVIGGKLNGVATKLERGSRVVNSTDTRNLLGGLSSMLGYSGLNGQTIGTVSNNNTSTKGVTNNIVVNANVADGEGLVDYLQSFANQMTQEAYAN